MVAMRILGAKATLASFIAGTSQIYDDVF